MPDVFPVKGGHSYTNDWGAPRSGGRKHAGTDIFATRGTPVVAVADGKITAAGDDGGKGGLRIWLNGSWYYAHLDGLAKGIRQGVSVKAGQVIGYVGDSGNAKGGATHLHFGYDPKGGQSAGGSWANPFPILKSLEGKHVDVPVAATSGSNTPTTPSTDWEQIETDRTQRLDASMGQLGEVAQPVTTGTASRGYAGQAPAIAPIVAPQIETWQSLSILPYASPDTQRYLQLAQMGYGNDNAA